VGREDAPGDPANALGQLAGAESAGVALDGAAVADGDPLGCSESVAVISPPGVSFGVP
jgi:hypothetical protein